MLSHWLYAIPVVAIVIFLFFDAVGLVVDLYERKEL